MKTFLKNKSLIQIVIFALALASLSIYQFSTAVSPWAPPSANPPGNNVDLPLNVGTANQIKLGDLTAVNMKAGSKMWAPEYCDETGANCWDASTIGDKNLTVNNGYAWIGGMLFQWGRACPGAATANYPFPTPFPTAVLSVVGSGDTANPGATRANHTAVAVNNSTVEISAVGGGGDCTVYTAIGH